MTYKLNHELRFIKSPVVLLLDGQEFNYPNGEILVNLKFDKNYLVDSITARDNHVVVTLKENDQINAVNWAGEEAVGFVC